MVNLLLKFKADPNDSQTDGMSLLFSALTKPDILEALLAAGGNVDSHLSEGKTLLDQAVNGNYPQVAVDILLKHGADPNARDSRGYTPLNYAVGVRQILTRLSCCSTTMPTPMCGVRMAKLRWTTSKARVPIQYQLFLVPQDYPHQMREGVRRINELREG